MTSDEFRQAEYWIDRHKRLRDDPRSVGNLAATREQNEAGEIDFREAVSAAARLLAPGRRTILDLGCGYGRAAAGFIDAGFDYTGIDVSEDAIQQAVGREPRGTFLRADLLQWVPDRTYDVVSVFYVLVHFVRDEDWGRFLDACCRAVAPGGRLLLADHFPTLRSGAAHFVSRPFDEYLPALERHGLTIDQDMAAGLVERLPASPHVRQFRFIARR